MVAFKKAYGWFIRNGSFGKAELMVYTAPNGALRFPGGTVEEHEDLLTGLRRELREEIGIHEWIVLRKLGVHRYYKPDVQKHVERHDYLLRAITPLPNCFVHTVRSSDKDNHMVFEYRWIGLAQCHELDWEFSAFVATEYISEIYIGKNLL